MTLVEGKVTTQELADFFQIKKSTFKTYKKKYMKLLEEYYADYHEEGYGRALTIYIDRVMQDTYIPELGARNGVNYREEIKKDFPKIKNEIDTCVNISKKIGDLHKDDNWEIKDSTRYNYTVKAKVGLYGRMGKSGEIGSCKSIYVKEDFIPLTSDEMAKIAEAAKEVYGAIEDKDREALDSYWSHEINKHELDEILKENQELKKDYSTYLKFKVLCIEKLGFEPRKATLFEETVAQIDN